MNVQLALKSLERLKFRQRIWGELQDALKPFLRTDIGIDKTMQVTGCSLDAVPQEYIDEVNDELTEILEEIDHKIAEISEYQVVNPKEKKDEPKANDNRTAVSHSQPSDEHAGRRGGGRPRKAN